MSKANPVYNSVLKNFFSTNDIKFSSTAQRMHFAALLYEAGWEVYDKTRTVANAQFPNLTVDVTAGRFAGAAGVVISGPIICIATAVLLLMAFHIWFKRSSTQNMLRSKRSLN